MSHLLGPEVESVLLPGRFNEAKGYAARGSCWPWAQKLRGLVGRLQNLKDLGETEDAAAKRKAVLLGWGEDTAPPV